MIDRIREFKSFITGHQECFCCDDCDQEEDCLTLYNAQKLMEQLEVYDSEELDAIPETLLEEMEKLFERLQECAWQRCDCRSRY